MSHCYFMFLIFLLFQCSFCDYSPCQYKETPDQEAVNTDNTYLDSTSGT